MVCASAVHAKYVDTARGTGDVGRKEIYATGRLSNVYRNRNPHEITEHAFQTARHMICHRLRPLRGVLLRNVDGRLWPTAVVLGYHVTERYSTTAMEGIADVALGSAAPPRSGRYRPKAEVAKIRFV